MTRQPDRLIAILKVEGLLPSRYVLLAHGLAFGGKGVVPTKITCDRASPVGVVACDTVGVTFMNLSSAAQTAVFTVEYDATTVA